MTTSSENCVPSAPRPEGNHWSELTASLPESVATLDRWMDDQLEQLEMEQRAFVTHRSLRKNLRG